MTRAAAPSRRTAAVAPAASGSMPGAARSFLLYWLPALLFACVIFYMSSGPAPAFASLFSYEDKFLHFAEYGTYGLLLVNAMVRTAAPGNAGRALRYGVLTAWVTGACDELYQSAVPGRSSDVLDLLTDMTAVCVAAAVVWLAWRHWPRRAPGAGAS